MNFEEVLKVSAAIIVSLGGSTLLIAATSNWLANLWATRMLQNERAKHEQALEEIKARTDGLKQKELTRHFDKLAIYKDVIHVICEMLRELEAVSIQKQNTISPEIERSFALNRTKAYGYISLVSSQDVMDSYNELIDTLIPVMYEGERTTWEHIRSKADAMLNSMRKDIGITEGDIVYKGKR
jgi:hypothetical protein